MHKQSSDGKYPSCSVFSQSPIKLQGVEFRVNDIEFRGVSGAGWDYELRIMGEDVQTGRIKCEVPFFHRGEGPMDVHVVFERIDEWDKDARFASTCDRCGMVSRSNHPFRPGTWKDVADDAVWCWPCFKPIDNFLGALRQRCDGVGFRCDGVKGSETIVFSMHRAIVAYDVGRIFSVPYADLEGCQHSESATAYLVEQHTKGKNAKHEL